MSTYLYSYPGPLVFTPGDPKPGYVVFDQEADGSYLYLSDRPLSYSNQTLVGAWSSDGEILLDVNLDPIPIDPLFDFLRPVGNLDGDATGQVLYHHFLGHKPRYVQEVPVANTLPEYPADNQPIILSMERRWDDTPGFEGWGWIATIEFPDPNRPPDARAIGIYNDSWAYQYTTGAFVWTDTGEVDGDGVAIFKWQTLSPAGFATATKESIYYALLLGSVQEGTSILPEDQDSQTLYFWESNQGGGSAWVDSGETTIGMAGSVTLVSDNAPFIVDDLVRINGVEMTVTSLYFGANDGLVLSPYTVSPSGEVIEIWQ